MTIQAGKYRHRITISQAPTDASRDTFGGRKGAGSVLATVWAELQDWGGEETSEGRRETADVVTKFKIRYRADVTPAMTVSFEGDTYNLLSVLDFDGTRRELVLNCRKVVAG